MRAEINIPPKDTSMTTLGRTPTKDHINAVNVIKPLEGQAHLEYMKKSTLILRATCVTYAAKASCNQEI
jgi:hypothetical protein